jgi:hypothetical protein
MWTMGVDADLHVVVESEAPVPQAPGLAESRHSCHAGSLRSRRGIDMKVGDEVRRLSTGEEGVVVQADDASLVLHNIVTTRS